MRHIDQPLIRKWILERRERVPKPFAGEYPTRVMYARHEKGFYLGKPNRIEALKWRERDGFSGEVEFDADGLIRFCVMKDGVIVNSFVNTPLFSFYHPWTAPTAQLIDFEAPFALKRAKEAYKGKTQVIYSPYGRPQLALFDKYRETVKGLQFESKG